MNEKQYVAFVKEHKNSVYCPICEQWLTKDKSYYETGYYQDQYACCTENATQANANAKLVNMVSKVN